VWFVLVWVWVHVTWVWVGGTPRLPGNDRVLCKQPNTTPHNCTFELQGPALWQESERVPHETKYVTHGTANAADGQSVVARLCEQSEGTTRWNVDCNAKKKMLGGKKKARHGFSCALTLQGAHVRRHDAIGSTSAECSGKHTCHQRDPFHTRQPRLNVMQAAAASLHLPTACQDLQRGPQIVSLALVQFGERATRAATHAKRAPCLAKSVLIALAGRVCTRLLCPCQKGLEPRIEK
jgi:hypothetical protein